MYKPSVKIATGGFTKSDRPARFEAALFTERADGRQISPPIPAETTRSIQSCRCYDLAVVLDKYLDARWCKQAVRRALLALRHVVIGPNGRGVNWIAHVRPVRSGR